MLHEKTTLYPGGSTSRQLTLRTDKATTNIFNPHTVVAVKLVPPFITLEGLYRISCKETPSESELLPPRESLHKTVTQQTLFVSLRNPTNSGKTVNFKKAKSLAERLELSERFTKVPCYPTSFCLHTAEIVLQTHLENILFLK